MVDRLKTAAISQEARSPGRRKRAWDSIMQDSPLMSRIFGHLDEKERCRLLPLVSWGFYNTHRACRTKPKQLTIHQRVTKSMVMWFVEAAGSLETLSVAAEGRDHLPQLLAVAAVSAPNMVHLQVKGRWHGIMHSISMMSRLKQLKLDNWEFPVYGDASEIQQLSGLCSLQELRLGSLRLKHMTVLQAEVMWSALAELRHLRLLSVDIEEDESYGTRHGPEFFDCITLLTQISSLVLGRIEMCLIQEDDDSIGKDEAAEAGGSETADAESALDALLPSSFSKLTQLTALRVDCFLSEETLLPVLALPKLQDLALKVDCFMRGVPLADALGTLTCLEIEGCHNRMVPLDDILPLRTPPPMRTPPLPDLRRLDLKSIGLNHVPVILARTLERVTFLDLSCNCFTTFPLAVSQITSLHTLSLAENPRMELEGAKTVAALQALPHLHLLDLEKEKGGWNQLSVATLIAIKAQLPHLEMSGFAL